MSWAQTGAESDLQLPAGSIGLAEAAFSQGIELAAEGRADDALELFSLAVELRPGVALYHETRGDAYLASNRADSILLAKADYQAAIKLEPERKRAWEGLAQVTLATGRLGEALDAYEKLCFGSGALDPQYLTDLVALYVTADEVERGIEAIEPHTGSAGTAPEILLQLATLHRYQEHFDAALALTARVANNPDASEAARKMAGELQSQWLAERQDAGGGSR